MELENFNNRIKQNLNYTELETTDTNQQWGELKACNSNSFKKRHWGN
jgi:hypothetical protein